MHTQSAHELRSQFISGNLSAKEIVDHSLNRIAIHDSNLNAFLNVLDERARKKAKELDQKRKEKKPLGKLAGVPIAIKDNIHIKGETTTCASKMLEHYRALFDSTVVRLLEEEDAILIGKTNMDEFAMGASGTHSAFSPTRNPWNLNASPGGSSSGSAACVSARLAPIALGSDTGGSIRQPAAFTGITSFKPTYGRISRYGLVAFASSLDHIGPLACCVKDCALTLEVLGKYCCHDSTSINAPPVLYTAQLEKSIAGEKIGIPWEFLETLQGEARQNFQQSVQVLQDLGAEIVDVDLSLLKYSIAVYYVLATAEASTNLARYDGLAYGLRSSNPHSLNELYNNSRKEGFGSEVKNRIILGTSVLSGGHREDSYGKAQKIRTLTILQIHEAFKKCSLIALPTTSSTAFPLDGIKDPLEEYLQDLYTISADLAGLPAASLPSGFSKDNMPFGFQLLGPQMQDERVLQFAQAFESATDFAKQIPPQFGART